MTDLPAALRALLREVREEMPRHHGEVYDTWQARVDAEQARCMAAASIDAAIKETDSFCPWWATHGGLSPERAAECLAKVHAATLQAARAARSTPEVKP